ncbi:F-box/kelch-repeat protein At3g23880 isoform X2 [Medicago truncatula]|uniref:F-box/kelch-repeat protein At3g23880 isoform X2 n=1 Tax=Medicago truncatula TaxID=3880 RepID=UPI000D2F363B|nr:F-box/kelch-repeat protein At3g23880 isoform X2 [Medicago truncatula]
MKKLCIQDISEMVNLGLDLETEILAWLPLKSLMLFRCVQRSWNVLVQSPAFLKRRHMNMHDSPSLMILNKKQNYVTLLSCDNLIHIKSPFSNNSHYPITMEGICNGVFCLKGFCWYNSCVNELAILNPTTREVHRIPHTCYLSNGSYLYGFGADDSNIIDFKVVKLCINNHWRKHKLSVSSAEVYSLITKSWTPTRHPPPPFTIITRQCPFKYNTLVNGVYHWITKNSFYHRYDGVANILCFNFRNDQFHQLRGPTLSAEDRYFLCDEEVAEIKGFLAYVVQCHYNNLKIWVMDHRNGWEKKYNIVPPLFNFRMCGLWKNGDQLLGGRAGELLRSYDHQGNSLCQFQIDVDYAKYFWIHEKDSFITCQVKPKLK